jgi:hypothetical protein
LRANNKGEDAMVPAIGKQSSGGQLGTAQWVGLGVVAAVTSVIAVLIVRALALAIWPDLASFDPLGNMVRAIIFTAVPALVATALLAWLAARRDDPVGTFVRIAAIVLVLSFIPDYALPIPNKTMLGSTVAAFLHVIAAIATVGVLVTGYRRQTAAR